MAIHKGLKWIGFGWSAFIAENLLLSHNRDSIISKFSEETYHRAYNSLSALAMSSVVYGYFRYGRKQGPLLFKNRNGGIKLLGVSLQAFGIIGFSQILPKMQSPLTLQKNEGHKIVFENKCPFDFNTDKSGGMLRITRHPALWSFGFLSVGTALKTIYATEMLMFSFPFVFVTIGTFHQDYRHRRGSGGYLDPKIDMVTSNVPFVALINGHQSWDKLYNELKFVNCGLFLTTALLAKLLF
jgi:uncharacterized membrane protein